MKLGRDAFLYLDPAEDAVRAVLDLLHVKAIRAARGCSECG
jgi:hypothetical protein